MPRGLFTRTHACQLCGTVIFADYKNHHARCPGRKHRGQILPLIPETERAKPKRDENDGALTPMSLHGGDNPQQLTLWE